MIQAIFCGKSDFEDDSSQTWLVFQSIPRYSIAIDPGNRNILSSKFDESIKPPTTPTKVLNPTLDYVGTKARVKFRGDCFKQEKVTFNHGEIVNIYIVYEIEKCVNISSYPT